MFQPISFDEWKSPAREASSTFGQYKCGSKNNGSCIYSANSIDTAATGMKSWTSRLTNAVGGCSAALFSFLLASFEVMRCSARSLA